MATLTGAQGVSTGRYHAGIMTNNERWESLAYWMGKMTVKLNLIIPFEFC